jgi:hypothetical protein
LTVSNPAVSCRRVFLYGKRNTKTGASAQGYPQNTQHLWITPWKRAVSIAFAGKCEKSVISGKTDAILEKIWYNPIDCCEQVFERFVSNRRCSWKAAKVKG